jgi:hypothetical protein
MVERPYENALGGGYEKHRDPDEGSLRYVETPMPVGAEMRFEPGALFGGGEPRHVMHDEFELHLVVYVLDRLVEPFPSKRRSQDRVPRDDRVPCALERRHVERMAHPAYDLGDVDARVGREQGVEEHSFLQRGQRVGIDHTPHAAVTS